MVPENALSCAPLSVGLCAGGGTVDAMKHTQTNIPRFILSSSKLLTKNVLDLGQSLVTCGLVTGAIGRTRTRHGLLYGLNGLMRYFAHPFRNGTQRARRRLSHPDHRARRSRRPSGNYCGELVVVLCFCAPDGIQTWTGVTRCHRFSERRPAHSCRSRNSHDSASTSARYT